MSDELNMFERPKVIIESPYAGNKLDVITHEAYAKVACLDAIKRGEIPWASHLFYTQFLDDKDPEHRKFGIQAGYAWGEQAHLVAFYTDHGWSKGMIEALRFYETLKIRCVERKILK